MLNDDFGNRMKEYEAVETARKFDTYMPVYARIDGRSFSKFTQNMQRPFDNKMINCMADVTAYLVKNTNATIGYTQSDEISLVWNNQLFFDGKIQKSCSVLASMAAAAFAFYFNKHFGYNTDKFPHFDCRIIQLPNKTEATNMLLWRSIDASKNAINMAARHYFTQSELHKKSTTELVDMMNKIGVKIEDYPTNFRFGTWIKRQQESKVMTEDELLEIPEQHRPPINTPIVRHKVSSIDMPAFVSIKNREAVIFDDATPVT